MKHNWTEIRSRSELQILLDREDVFSTTASQNAYGYFVELKSIGYFCWFETQEAMLMHLVQVEILHSPNHVPERAEYENILQQLIPIAQSWQNQTQNSEQTCSQFNQVFPDFKIAWLGTYQDLCVSQSTFETQVRQAFGTPFTAAIPEQKSPDFIAFLENYGL